MPIRCRIAPLGTIGWLAIGTSALAGVQYQVNFESYSLGKLDGQHNWFQYDGDAPPATVSVQNSVVRPLTGGAQAVEFRVNGPAPNSFQNFTDVWSTDSSVSAEQIAIEPIVTIQWDMMRSPLEGGTIGTGVWGIDIYDSDDTHLAASIGAWDDPFGPAVGVPMGWATGFSLAMAASGEAGIPTPSR